MVFFLLFCSFCGLMAVSVPIGISMGLASMAAILYKGGMPLTILAQKMFTGLDSFPLLAVPFFILAGCFMGTGGISARLVRFASVLVGHVRGGLAHVVIVGTIFFSGVSGSSAADTAAIGSIMIPSMVKRGYPRPLSTAIVAAAGGMGVNIPPCIIMVLYGIAANVSIGYLFAAGFIPGFISGLALMVMVYFIAKRDGLPKETKASLREMLIAARDAVPPLLMPVIILGGILSGVFTATESAVIAVVYGVVLSMCVYRELHVRDVPRILVTSAKLTGMVMLVVGMSTTFAWIVTVERVPQMITEWILAATQNPWVFLLFTNVLMLIVGMFIDATPAMITFTPILFPIAQKLGIDPVHFGIVMVTNLGVGFVTPPVGSCLFVASAIGETTIDEVFKPLLPFLAVMVVALILITYWPGMTLFIPRLLGYKG
ncbi:MAG: TRAP transporter large permease [candidate division NC10 bacterium]|nr:TRAP transporter large permease [candidate division NC10 bacterium]